MTGSNTSGSGSYRAAAMAMSVHRPSPTAWRSWMRPPGDWGGWQFERIYDLALTEYGWFSAPHAGDGGQLRGDAGRVPLVGWHQEVAGLKRRHRCVGLAPSGPEPNGRRMLKGKQCDEVGHSRHVASAPPFSLKLVEDQSADHGRNNARDDSNKKFAHSRCSPLMISRLRHRHPKMGQQCIGGEVVRLALVETR